MIHRAVIPVYATIFAVALLIVVRVQRMGQMFASGEGSVILGAVPILALAYFCYKTVKEEGTWLFLLPLVSLYVFISNVIKIDSFEGAWFFAQLLVVITSLCWLVTRFVELKRSEKVFGLASVQKVKLLDPISTAFGLYGSPVEQEPDERNAEATTYKFEAGEHHEAVITEWKGEIHSITYWSHVSLPGADLSCMLEAYSEGFGWVEIEKGYWHQRKCDKVRLWCSVAPAIGVGTLEFLASGSDDEVEDDE